MKPYKGNENYIFVSYSHKDIGFVKPICECMQERGYRIWYDNGIAPSDDYSDIIAERIEDCKIFIAFICTNYLESDFCNKELKFALNLQKQIIPIFLEDVVLPSGLKLRISDIQSIRKFELDNNEFFSEVFDVPGINLCKAENVKKILSEVENALLINNCVRIDKVTYAKLSDNVFDYLAIALKNGYTHIPVLDEYGCVVGVLGYSTFSSFVLKKIRENNQIILNKDIIFKNIESAIKIENQIAEKFEFLSKESTIFDAKIKTTQVYEKYYKGIGMFFITENGQQNEPLLGILTPTGILGRKIFE